MIASTMNKDPGRNATEYYHIPSNNDDSVEVVVSKLADPPAFSDKSIQMAFIRKVYGILVFQLFVTFSLTAALALNDDMKSWINENPVVFFLAMVVTVAVMLALTYRNDITRKTPHNLILLAVFTVAEGIMLGTLAALTDTNIVLLAIGMTALICLALTAYTFQTRHDFTTMGMIFVALFTTFFIFSILMLGLSHSSFLQVVLASCGALLFSFHFIYNTQLMIGAIGGKQHEFVIFPDEYIFAILSLYLDVINIFQNILFLARSTM